MQREFALVDIVILFLKKFKIIFICALVFAVILGSLRIYKIVTNQDSDAQAELLEKIELSQKELDRVYAERDAIVEYMKSSIYFNLDSYNKSSKTITFFVETDYQIMPGMTYQNPDKTGKIIEAYANIYKDKELFKQLSQIIGRDKEAKYIEELISSSVLSSGIVQIKADCVDELTASKLADTVFSYMKDKITTTVGEHQLRVISEYTSTEKDDNLTNMQNSKVDELTKKELFISEKELALKKQMDGSFIVQSKKASLKKIALYVFIGGVIGAFISFVWEILVLITNCKLQSSMDLMANYSFPILSVFPNLESKKRLLFEKLISRLEGGRDFEISDEQALKLAVSNIKAKVEKLPAQILLTGTLYESDIEKMKDQLLSQNIDNIQYIATGCVLNHYNAVEALDVVDYIILVERRGDSEIKKVNSEILRIEQSKKTIIGVLLL